MADSRLSRRALLASLGATAATAAAGCTAPTRTPNQSSSRQTTAAADAPEISLSPDAAWSTYGFEPGHTGHNPDAAGVGTDPSQVWGSYVEGFYTLREPAVAEGRLFVGSDTSMWAFDATTGEQAWRENLASMPHHFPPTYRDGTLYAVSKESGGVKNAAPGYVWAFSPETGNHAWRTSVPVTSTVAHDGDRLYVAGLGGDRGFVQALDPADGDKVWRFDVPDAPRSYVTGAPAYADGSVLVAAAHVAGDGSNSGALYALEPTDGSVQWRVALDEAVTVAPVVADGTVYVAGRSGTVHALTTGGDPKWSKGAGANVYTRPTYADGRLFVLTTGDVVAFGEGGTELWRAGKDRTQMTGMAVAGDALYVGGEPLFALDATDGSLRFELDIDVFHGSYGAPVAVDDVLYAGICVKRKAGALYDNYVRAYA